MPVPSSVPVPFLKTFPKATQLTKADNNDASTSTFKTNMKYVISLPPQVLSTLLDSVDSNGCLEDDRVCNKHATLHPWNKAWIECHGPNGAFCHFDPKGRPTKGIRSVSQFKCYVTTALKTCEEYVDTKKDDPSIDSTILMGNRMHYTLEQHAGKSTDEKNHAKEMQQSMDIIEQKCHAQPKKKKVAHTHNNNLSRANITDLTQDDTDSMKSPKAVAKKLSVSDKKAKMPKAAHIDMVNQGNDNATNLDNILSKCNDFFNSPPQYNPYILQQAERRRKYEPSDEKTAIFEHKKAKLNAAIATKHEMWKCAMETGNKNCAGKLSFQREKLEDELDSLIEEFNSPDGVIEVTASNAEDDAQFLQAYNSSGGIGGGECECRFE